MWVPKGFGNPVPTTLLAITHMATLLGWLCTLPAAFLGIYFIFLASLTSWHFFCIDFTRSSHMAFSGADYRESNPATHYLIFQAFL
jgi:hypothetical protein